MKTSQLKIPQLACGKRLESRAALGTTAAVLPAVLPALHSLHFRVHTRVLVTLAVAFAAVAVLWAEPPYRAALRQAAEAQKAGNLPVAIEQLETVRALRPDYPRALVALARAYAAAQRPADALAVLEDAARRGLAANLSRDPALSSLTDHPDFARVSAALLANAEPRGTLAPAQTLPAQSGIIESVALDAQGNAYFADVRERCIWHRAADGSLRRFTAEDRKLLGAFGLALDSARGVLWASTSAVPVTRGYDAASEKGRAVLIAFDLATGRARESLALPADSGEHVLGTIRLGADGAVYASDSSSPVIWRAAPGATQLEAWLEHTEFGSLQGLAFSADGRTLYAADYANGIWSIDVATKTPALLRPAADAALFGIDDLQYRDGSLIAVQNGSSPARILRIAIVNGVASAEVLARSPDLADAATGTIVGSQFVFIGNSGWSLHERATGEPPPRDVRLISLTL